MTPTKTTDIEDQLKRSIADAIGSFNRRRAALLRAALEEGGDDAVQGLEHEYDVLRDAYFEILRRQLDRNNHLYEQLTVEADKRAQDVKNAIESLNRIAEITSKIASAVSAIARLLVILGV